MIEGIDGAGKSSLCRSLKEELEKNGRKTIITQEPTYDEIGSMIREGVIEGITQKAESLLFVADRAMHTEKIRKWTEDGNIVICDRYFASTVAYQSSGLHGEALDREWLLAMNEPVIMNADLTILLDIDPKKGLERISDRDELSKFEEVKYLENVRSEYLRLADEFDFTIMDAEEGPAEMIDEAINKIKELF